MERVTEMTYDIVHNDGGFWLVFDAYGEPHGGRFGTFDEAEKYAEGNISMFEDIEKEGM